MRETRRTRVAFKYRWSLGQQNIIKKFNGDDHGQIYLSMKKSWNETGRSSTRARKLVIETSHRKLVVKLKL